MLEVNKYSRMKNILLFIIVFLPAIATGQMQQGFIRTAGNEQHVDGIPLANVTVKPKGNNATTSDNKGWVEIWVGNKKEGSAYQLTSVYKKGYELIDPMLIGRALAYSSKTPLEITMISSKELNRMKSEMEEKVFQEVQENYSGIIVALNDSLRQGTINEEIYREKIEFINKQRDLFEPLIAMMAERYARTDFAKLDSVGKLINTYIITGQIEKADLLIAERGSIEERIAAIERQKELYGKADALIERLDKELQKQYELYKREREDIANDLYHKYAISLAQFRPQDAGEYITLRAELDTTNIDYQLEAGAFALDYLTDFSKAEMYYIRALNRATDEYGKKSAMVSHCLNHLGGMYLQSSKFSKAIECRKEALKIRKSVYGEQHTGVAACYNNLANCYYSMERIDEARICADSAIIIYLNNEDTNPADLADAYTTKGGIEIAKGNLNEALDFYKLSLSITDSVYGMENTHSATTINNIGIIKDYLGASNEAVSFYRRSLDIYKKIYGENHPNVATAYSNLGTTYQDLGILDSAIIASSKALEIRLNLFGEFHEDVAISLNNMGSLSSSLKEYELAITYYKKALTVTNTIFGNKTSRFATTLGNVAIVYYKQHDYLSAIDYFNESLYVYINYHKEKHQEIHALAHLNKRCYEAILKSNTLSEEGRIEAQKDYDRFIKDFQYYINNE